MKLLAYILLLFGDLCGIAGVFVIFDNIKGGDITGFPWPVGLCLCLLGTINLLGFKFLQLRFFPPKQKNQDGSER